MELELAIRGGMLIDGSGAPARRADLGVAGGRIAEIAPSVRAARELDASGRIVVPGFLDIHTHYDPAVLWDPWLTPSSCHGVTSVVAGNCGYSLAPVREEVRGSLLRTLDKVEDMRLETLEAGVTWGFETYSEYLERIRRRGVALNFGGYVGHAPVRLCALGEAAYERAATDAELAQMKRLVAESIRGGALGFSSDRAGFHVGDGGRPVPSCVASQAETEALMRVTAEIGQGIVHVAPGENNRWVYEFQPKLGRRINWSALLTYPPEVRSRTPYRETLGYHAEGRSRGADVWVQVTCRPIVQQIVIGEPTPFYQFRAFAELVPLDRAGRRRAYADPRWRARAWQELQAHGLMNTRWTSFRVAESRSHPERVGRSAAELAAERGGTPLDAACELALADDLETRFDVTFANDDEQGVALLLSSEGCILGLSDAGAHIGQICDAVMPSDFLAHWVRDRALMPLERGIRKLTGELADVFELDRGYLRVGAPADVAVLDYERLDPGPLRRVRDMPASGERLVADAPLGVDHVLVNGTPIRAEGKALVGALERLPGAILRSGR
jgi:N-acyl-D-aspartate/D-glutamate deacylase